MIAPTCNITYLSAGSTAEQVISAVPARLVAIVPDATTVGTVTVRDANAIGGSNVVGVAAIGLLQAGKEYKGAKMQAGLTVQLSSASDKVAVLWNPLP